MGPGRKTAGKKQEINDVGSNVVDCDKIEKGSSHGIQSRTPSSPLYSARNKIITSYEANEQGVRH